MLKLAFISAENPFAPQNNGGIGTYTGIVSQGLARLGCQVHCITVGDRNDYLIQPNLMLHGIPSAQSRYKFYLENMQLFSQKVDHICSAYGLDLVEAPEWLAQGFTTTIEKRVPVVTRLHTPLFLIEDITGQKIYRESEEISRLEMLQAYNSCSVTSPSTSLAHIVKERWGIESKVIPNPIDINAFLKQVNLESSTFIESDYILFMGRLELRKGVLVFAESLKEILPRMNNLKVVFCGKDSVYNRRSVKSQILKKCIGFEDRLIFISHADFDNKISLMKKAKIVVLPSLWENFSYVALEAMSLGKTIIATDVGGYSEMIENGKSGYLVAPNNSGLLSEIIVKVLDGRLCQTGHEARQRVQSCFSIQSLAKDFVKLYASYI